MVNFVTVQPDKAVPSIAPTTAERHLQQQLLWMVTHSATARALLHPGAPAHVPAALTAPLDVRIISTAAATATAGNVSTINVNGTIFGPGGAEKNVPAGEGLKEFVESTVFELVNAANAAHFTTLDAQLVAGLAAPVPISLRTYGEAKANLEAEASMTVADTIRDLAAAVGYVPSAWGAAHVAATANFIGNLAGFQAVFRLAPHDAAAAAHDPASLPSWEMYAFKQTMGLAGESDTRNLGAAVRVTKGGRALDTRKLKNLPQVLPTNQSAMVNSRNIFARVFCNAYLEACHVVSTDPGTVVTWAGGTSADWRMTPAMQAIAPDAGNALRDRIVNAIRSAQLWPQISN
jgi:hypothetical protein